MSAVGQIFHASCVAVNGQGVLLLGDSGAGKSDLALRLMDAGAALVADDRVAITQEQGMLFAAPAPRLSGLLEVRGVGVLSVPYCAKAPLRLAVSLAAREAVERMPAPTFFSCEGLQLPLHYLHAFDRSTEAKIRMLLAGLL